MIGWVVAAVVVLGGGYLLVMSSSSEDAMMEDEFMEKAEDAMMEDTDSAMVEKDSGGVMEGEAMMEKSGSYEAYSAEKLAKANEGDVVLFFRASWCPTCTALDASIKASAPVIPSGLTILDVDYDNSQSLKQKYGVTYQHTLVQVDASGTLIKKWSGSSDLAALVAEVQ
jgi:thiol-disulfide isomerase/thioredoxin